MVNSGKQIRQINELKVHNMGSKHRQSQDRGHIGSSQFNYLEKEKLRI